MKKSKYASFALGLAGATRGTSDRFTLRFVEP